MNRKYVFDIEVFPNFFLVSFLNVDDITDIKPFIISWDLKIDHKDKLKEFLFNDVDLLIGYNNLFYDTPILLFVCDYNGNDINKDAFELSGKIINSDRNWNPKRDLPWKQLDLMKLMAFDKLGVSLKQCAINLKWKKIQDLPLPPESLVKREDVETIIQYNYNDVFITEKLYQSLQPQIKLREELGKIYSVDVLSASDSKIANTLLEKFYIEETGIDIKNVKNLRTKRDFLWLKDCICPGIKFKTKKLRNLKFEIANTLVVAENNFSYKKKIEFGNCEYELGVGGLHSEDKAGKFITDENYIISDLDVASYYPNIIINNKIKPDHLNEDFVSILTKITKERLEAKKSGDKIKADALKITVNSIFGKLGSETFWLEDARAMLTVTVSGQLFLLMLIESLTLAGITVISANTDGIVCKIPRNLENKYKEVCTEWQNNTGFELEFTPYNLYVRSDVNNYITKKANGETKEKGRYLKEIDLKKGYHYPVVARCLYEYFINNKPLEQTLHEAEDILDFCISQKSGKDFLVEYRTENCVENLQKTIRFFISKKGGYIVKKNKETGSEIGLYVGKLCQILNDHDNKLSILSYDIDYDFYKEEAQKYIDEIENSSFPDTLEPEELSTDEADGIELEIDNFDTSKIVIKPAKFRHSKASYFFDKANNTIYRGIISIKYINSQACKDLDRFSKNKYNSFVDFLVDVEENSAINSRQLEILIKLNYFEEFGKNKKLMDIYTEFSKGKNKYVKTLKEETRQKRKQELLLFENNTPNKPINILEQFYFEEEVLEQIQTIYPDLDKKYVFIMKLSDKYSPRMDVRCLANGKTSVLKIQRGIYEQNAFLAGDIIFCNSFEHKKAVRFVDGEFIEDDTKPMVWWIRQYKILSKEEIEKLLIN